MTDKLTIGTIAALYEAGFDQSQVDCSFGDEERNLPLIIQPRNPHLDILVYTREHRELLRTALHRFGALLFRGFKVSDPETFQRAVSAVTTEPLKYLEQSSPRHAVTGSIYTSTDYPPNEEIILHNEQSYNAKWCGKINFFCEVAPAQGGQTPIASTRHILGRIAPEIRELFAQKQYRYVRNFGTGFGVSWQVSFQTADRNEVEAYCKANDIHFEWLGGERLRTWVIRKAIHEHPFSGEQVWFNHLTFFHISSLPQGIGDYLRKEFAEIDLPNQTFFGDGSSIPQEIIDDLRKIYREERVVFNWQQGDILMLDNMLTSHGRAPFSGPRRILVAMTEPMGAPNA